MKESVVLIMTLTPTCTELARHLALSGISLLILKNESVVSEDDTQSDFLFGPPDIGMPVSKLLKLTKCRGVRWLEESLWR